MRAWPIGILLVSLLIFSGTARGADDDADGIDDAREALLLDTYAPVLYFHPDEPYFPVSIDFALDNSVLEQYNAAGPVLLDATPTAAELAAYDVPVDPFVMAEDVVYLNNTLGGLRDDAGIRAGYASGGYARTVYGHVSDDGGQTGVQFWFFYAYNPGTWNEHEGDWEMIEVVLSGDAPVGVGYSQHESGERMVWADADKEGTHPKVYVAKGSHANYLRSFQGRVGIAGDAVSDAGPRWAPTDYAIVNVGEAARPMAGSEWLRFAGPWGEFFPEAEVRAEGGPPGPAYRNGGGMFNAPVQWVNALSVPDSNLLLLNSFLANLLTIFFLVLGVSVALKVYRLWRLHKRTGAGFKMWPYAHVRSLDRKSIALLLALAGLAVGVAGFLMPWYVVTVNVNAPGFLVTDGAVEFLKVDGVGGLLINPLRSASGTADVSIFPVPLGIMWAVTTGYFLFRITGTKTSRRLGARFVTKGVVAVLPLVLVLLITGVLLGSLQAVDPTQGFVNEFFGPIAASPFGGSNTVSVEGGSATLAWGLGTGSWLLVVSAVMMFVAGGLALSQSYAFVPERPKEPVGETVGVPVESDAEAPPMPEPPTSPPSEESAAWPEDEGGGE